MERELRFIQAELADMARIKSQLDSHYNIEIVKHVDSYKSITGLLAIEIGGVPFDDAGNQRITKDRIASIVARLHPIDADTAEAIHGEVNKLVKELEDELIVRAKDIAKNGGV